MTAENGKLTPKGAALAALRRAQEESQRKDGVNLMVLGYLLEDVKIKVEAIDELRKARPKTKAAKGPAAS